MGYRFNRARTRAFSKILNRGHHALLLLWEALKRFDRDHGFFLASGVTFSLVICLIPLLLLLLAFVGTYLYSTKEVLNQIRLSLEDIFPASDPRFMRNILRVIRDRKIVGILGLAGLIWTSTWVFSSLRTALNLIFHVEKGQGILHGKTVDLLMILLAGFFLFSSMTLTSVMTYLQGFPLGIKPVIQLILKYLVPFLFTFCMFFLTYKIVPNRNIPFPVAFQAACFTSVLWEAAKLVFGWYVSHLARFSMVYGSLSALAVFFLWVYYSSAILLLGGEIAFLLDRKGKSTIMKMNKT